MKRFLFVLTAVLLLTLLASCDMITGLMDNVSMGEDGTISIGNLSGLYDIPTMSVGDNGEVSIGGLTGITSQPAESSAGESSVADDISIDKQSFYQSWSALSDEEKESFEANLSAHGYTLISNPDGSITLISPDGTVTMYKADGSVLTEESGSVKHTGDWPDNLYTQMLPEPSFEIYACNVSSDGIAATSKTTTFDDLAAYIELVKANGFTVDLKQSDRTVGGVRLYSFSASDGKGYVFEASVTSDFASFSLKRS